MFTWTLDPYCRMFTQKVTILEKPVLYAFYRGGNRSAGHNVVRVPNHEKKLSQSLGSQSLHGATRSARTSATFVFYTSAMIT